MHTLRALVHRYRLLALVLVLAALAVKAAVPAGYMVHQRGTVLTVEICTDASGGVVKQRIMIPASGETGKAADAQGKAPATCPYAGLGFAALGGGADALLLALAMGFILALGFSPSRAATPKRVAFLRPPLRGPPAFS
jgi:hypothetical protein